jgi:ATP-dependent exoDNAse (exonuclease V) alpha subunit
MNWSPQQEQARSTVARWMRDRSAPQTLYLAGFAGSGKTTLANDLVSSSNRKWLFAAYTGKAAHVLSTKGCAGARTIHSLIYRYAGEVSSEQLAEMRRELGNPATPEPRRRAITRELLALTRDRGPRFALWETGPLSLDDVEGVVVDEVSMVNPELGRDLESFDKKILVLGDPAQLPPVKGGGYFTAREPDIMLTEVHRQARDRGVLRLATHIREGGSLSSFPSAPDAEILTQRSTPQDERTRLALAADQVLVGLNRTRHDLNRRYRVLRERSGAMPYAGDRLVCLRNERESGLFNGSQWIVVDAEWPADGNTGALTVRSEDDDRVVVCDAWTQHFQGRGEELKFKGPGVRDASEFDWGYALTVHKAQGSGWPRVLVVDESRRLGGTEPRRWLYTAVSRAAEHVTVLT